MNKKILYCGLLLAIIGCSSSNIEDILPDNRPDYKQSKTINKLEIPPNLTDSEIDDRLKVPEAANSAKLSDYKTDATIDNSKFAENYKDIRTNGDANWIELSEKPENAWKSIEEYWQNYGITLARNDKTLGIMETNWLERIDNKPRGSVQKLVDTVFGSGTDDIRDKYKVRMDYDAKTKTSYIYLTHSSVTEVALTEAGKAVSSDKLENKRDVTNYGWLNTKRDPNLEVEMLRRISLYINSKNKSQGKNETIVKKEKNKTETNKLSIESLANDTPALIINDNYNQAWILLGIAIDRSNYQIIEQNRSSGLYAFTQTTITKSGLIFTSTKQDVTTYQLGLADQGKRQVAVIKTVDGKDISSEKAKQILEKISQEIKF